VNGTETAPLDLRAVLSSLRRAAPDVAAAERTEDALRAVVEALVPHVADFAEIFVIGNDGRLHRKAASTEGEVDLVGAEDEAHAAALDHPASLAVRERAAAALLDGDRPPTILSAGSNATPPPDDFASIALPLLRDDQAVGALWLGRLPGRRYLQGDLDLILDLGDRVSQMLDNRRLRREVRSAQRAKADFLAVVNHELRTPLTAVVGYADLLEAGIPGPVTEKQRRQLVRIKESAWDLLELIDGILGYARYEGEHPDIHIRKVDPEALLHDAVRVVEAAAEEKGLNVRVEASRPLPLFPTDVEKARRVLFHLLSNAVKFTPEGEVCVRIGADADWVVFSISDTGIGIRPEERDAIFEPFWQGERPETRTAGGAGMGLSLALKLTELLSGRIEVDSEVGQGSTFTLRFPRGGPRPASL
jgi:signal transduction histidine kinase